MFFDSRRLSSRPPGFAVRLVLLMALLGAAIGAAKPAHALVALSIEKITWNVIGLDSNNVNVGPNEYPVGVEVCNTSTTETATNVVVNFVWDDPNDNQWINLSGPSTLTEPSLAPGECRQFYFNVVITRDPGAYDQSRLYHITATADNTSDLNTTLMAGELYVERLISQNRNDVHSIEGPSEVYLGNTYTFTMTSSTATNGYEQIESFLNFPSSMFEVIDTQTSYTAPPNTTLNRVYGDGCGWVDATRSCDADTTNDVKYGGDLVTVYTVRIVDLGAASVTNLIYDFSGSSYHYNSDYGSSPDNVLNINAVSPLDATKSSTLANDADGNGAPSPGDTLRYQINLENLGSADITGLVYDDTPDANTTLVNGSVATTQGVVTQGNTAGDISLTVDVGTLVGGDIVTITYLVTINDPLPDGVTELINQGVATSNELPPANTDDPNTAAEDDPTITPVVQPTASVVTRFDAVQNGEEAEVLWTTSSEVDTWGFLIFRSADGSRESAEQVTPQAIPSQGRDGGSYSWIDTTVQPHMTYTYWLQEIEIDGSTVEYGPRQLHLFAIVSDTALYFPRVSQQ